VIKLNSAQEFDQIAQEIFFPIYDIIAEDALDKTGKVNGTMLDIGCGGGHLGLSVLKNAAGLKGILMDSNPDAISIADSRIADWKFKDRAIAVVGDVHRIPLPNESIDLVVSRGSVMFWEDLERAFSEITRVLAPGGRTYIGGGMGSCELSEQIGKKMTAIDPEWHNGVRKRMSSHSDEDYSNALKELGVKYEFFRSPEKGRWIIIEKPGL
jgi:ubiquinone/menaquinone biosynthesis C-methylase UbiE